MKRLRKILVLTIALSMMLAGMTVAVSADTTTDLKSMKVYAVDAAGNKTEVPLDFSSTTYSYDLTVLSTTASISIEAQTADDTSTWSIEKDGINTKMDFGTNLTVVDVTSATGAVNKYTLNTTKLTEAEEATYEAPETTPDDKNKSDNTADKTVMVGKTAFQISTSFDKKLIPEGFKKSSEEYDGTKYPCIKGEVKDLTAFYLYNDETEGFYIYDSASGEFYAMNNIMIKSRMYTIVNPEETDGLLKSYDKKTVTIIDQEVKAWVLDEDEGMYLVYAMNWNGDTSLYCYDDNEKCFQRYLVSSDVNSQVEAANKAYENLQKKYNNLVDKYNILLKILCGLVIVIIILIFVIINMTLNKKEKKIKASKKTGNEEGPEAIEVMDEEVEEIELLEEEIQSEPETSEQTDAEESPQEQKTAEAEEIPQEQKAAEPEKTPQEQNHAEEEEAPQAANAVEAEKTAKSASEPEESETSEQPEVIVETIEPEESKRRFFGRKNVNDRSYGDEPTFGSANQSEEGFYGGEIDDEDEVLIDLTDDEPEKITPDEIEKNTAQAQQEAEEDLKETLKSMLPDDEEDVGDEDDDFEFIDLD